MGVQTVWLDCGLVCQTRRGARPPGSPADYLARQSQTPVLTGAVSCRLVQAGGWPVVWFARLGAELALPARPLIASLGNPKPQS